VEELIFRIRDLAVVRAPWRLCVSESFAWEWYLENIARQDILHCIMVEERHFEWLWGFFKSLVLLLLGLCDFHN
jgi:hypothetical protein